MRTFILCLCLIIVSCAREKNEQMRNERITRARKIVSILHSTHYFRQGQFGEEYVIEAQLRSLATKPITNIVLDVHVFNKENQLVAARRERVNWKKNKIKEKVNKLIGRGNTPILKPGETEICEIIFYASQLEPESPREKRKREINKKFRKPRKTNFKTIFPAKYKLSVYSAHLEGERRTRK